MIIPSAEPFFFPGGSTGVLLIHGFTGSPKEMRWMGEFFAQQGYTALGIRLAGHATLPDDMLRMRWRDWVASVEDGFQLLSSCCERMYAAGLSMGGVLSLYSAARLPLKGVIAMSTPYTLSDWRLPIIKYLSVAKPRVEKGNPDWHNPAAAEDHIDYPYYPTRAIAELRDLLHAMRTSLPQIHIPTLLVHSKADGSVPPENAENIFAHLASQDKTLLWVENSGHVVTREPDRDQIFQTADAFIKRINTGQA